MNTLRQQQNGSVSLFVVIFAALLIITIGTAFIRIMIQGQMQATANDLAKSALDSAYAGVEDAKRTIAEYYQRQCNSDDMPPQNGVRCAALTSALKGQATGEKWTSCDSLTNASGVQPDTSGVTIQTDGGSGADLNQAYTCLKVQMSPSDYLGALTPDVSRIMKLQSSQGNPTKIHIEWYRLQGNQTLNVDEGDVDKPYTLLKQWPTNRPPVIKAQLLQYGADFALSDFDESSSYNASLFLLPANTGTDLVFGSDTHGLPGPSLVDSRVNCQDSVGRYACSVTITLPDFGDATKPRTAYLKLSQFYSASNTDFRVTMLDADNKPLPFTDVQPVVDSTGRANDLFRRVQSRIDIGGSSVPNPESAVDVTKSLCKEFVVTADDKPLVAGSHMGSSGAACPVIPGP